MSKVPVLIDSLISLYSLDPRMQGVFVADGPPVTMSPDEEWLFIGYDGDPDGPFQAATSEGSWSDLSGRRQAETIALAMCLVVGRGGTDVKAARDRVYVLADVVDQVLQENHDAGLPGAQLRIASGVLRQQQDGGCQARLLLTVVCQTFT